MANLFFAFFGNIVIYIVLKFFHFRNLLVYQTLGAAENGLEATPDQIKTLSEQAKLCPPERIFRVADQLAEMEDKLRYVLSVRTLIEMTLIRASRIATVASIEELMRAVRALKGPVAASATAVSVPVSAPSPVPAAAPPASPPVRPAAPTAAPVATPAPAEEAPKRVLTAEEQRKLMDDKKLNEFMGMFKGAQITDIK